MRRKHLSIGGLCLAFAVGVGCKEGYRVGEHVLVEYDEGVYPAFIKEKHGRTKLVVHFQGCDAVWIREVTVDKVKGRILESEAARANTERRFACAPREPTPEQRAANSPFKVGDRVRVRWRGTTYGATIVGVVAADRYLVHYDGHESAWDEVVGIERMAGRK